MILEVCRACLGSEMPLLNLFDSVSEHGITLAEMFASTSGLPVVKDDQWPQSICTTCLMVMVDTYEMQMQIERNMAQHFT